MSHHGPLRAPRTEDELSTRARALAGRTLGELAKRLGQRVPGDQRRHKGWVGNLIEMHLGGTAGCRSVPDFERLGIELKTVPIGATGGPSESTYVCTTTLVDFGADAAWETSRVRHKLGRVLWIPVQADPALPMTDRRVGSPLLWSPDADEEQGLRADYEELMERIRLGQVEDITARDGVRLQIRPKGASSRARCWGVDENGHRFKTLPRGWYLRAGFTTDLLSRHFHMSRG